MFNGIHMQLLYKAKTAYSLYHKASLMTHKNEKGGNIYNKKAFQVPTCDNQYIPAPLAFLTIVLWCRDSYAMCPNECKLHVFLQCVCYVSCAFIHAMHI